MTAPINPDQIDLPNADTNIKGNVYFGGHTDAGQTGMRLFGGLVNGTIPGGFIDVMTADGLEGLRIRVDTVNGGTERVRVTAFGDVGIGTETPTERLALGSGNVRLPAANLGTDGNLYLGGRTEAGQSGRRLSTERPHDHRLRAARASQCEALTAIAGWLGKAVSTIS